AARFHALLTRCKKYFSPALDCCQQFLYRYPLFTRHDLSGPRDVQNVLTLKVALFRDAVVSADERAIFAAEQFNDLSRRPDEEFTFDAFRICILRRIKTAARIGHLTRDVI